MAFGPVLIRTSIYSVFGSALLVLGSLRIDFQLRAGFQPGVKTGGAQAGRPGLAHSPLFTHTGGGDTTQPGHVANDDNPPVPPQADPAPRPHGEDVTLDPDL